MNHPAEERLILHYYGEEADSHEVERHLDECAECRACYAALQRTLNAADALAIPERGGDYGAEVWRRIEGRLPARRRLSWQWTRALAYAALTGYTIGQVVMGSQAGPTNPTGSPAAGEQLQRLGELLTGAPRGRYPNVVESAADLTELTDDEAFSYGLQRMLDGLEAELAPLNPRRRAF